MAARIGGLVEQPFCLGQLAGGGRGYGLVEEAPNLPLGKRADELVGDLAVHKDFDGGDAGDVEGCREVLVFFGVDLDEFPATGGLRGHALQPGAERAARAAPRRPEIHQNEGCVAPLNDLRFEILNFVAYL